MPTTKKKTTTSKKKTAAKKSAAKKRSTTKKATTKKKAMKKTTKKKDPVHAEGMYAFWVTNGNVLHNLVDLLDALDQMEDDHYHYHAAGDQNDFSIWVEEVLCDEDCARALVSAKNRKNAVAVVKRHLKVYSL